MHHNPIKAMVVDDSAFMRQLISDVLRSDPGIEVVATASDPYQARDLIKQYNPDVLTLDVEMPKMDGLKFLENLMRLRPMPVVMVSSLTEAGARTTMEALALGAVDFFPKPKTDVERTFETVAAELIEKVRHAASARVRQRAPTLAPSESKAAGVVLPAPRPGVRRPDSGRLIAIGASTGGTEAIREVLQQLPADMPPVVIAQHIPAGFSLAFAQRLDRVCQLAVSEVKDGETLQPGHAYVAPGDFHLIVERVGRGYRASVTADEKVNRHRPSVDVLFRSVATAAAANAVGVILTGMGADGAAGLLEMRESGAKTIAQDEATSLVYGMPREAAKLGGAEAILPLDRIAAQVHSLVSD